MFITTVSDWFTSLGLGNWLSDALAITLFLSKLIVLIWIADSIAKRYLTRTIYALLTRARPEWSQYLKKHQVIKKLSHIAPAILIYVIIPLVEPNPSAFVSSLIQLIMKLTFCYVVIICLSVLNALLNTILDIYRQFEIADRRPIRSYVQLVKIIIFTIAIIIIVSVLLNRSPLAFFAGLGTLTAIIMLVFKDSLLGFVASIQLSINDMVRIGDWIDLPEYKASGDIIDISLSTVKVQNFDKTITTIPTYALLTAGVKNWRGMAESGGRRIKRAIYIDFETIRFCDNDMLERFSKIQFLSNYIKDKTQAIQATNQNLEPSQSALYANKRSLTNIGVFRAYLEFYLQHHPNVRKDYTLLIRQLQPTEKGLPLEIYAFVNDTNWINYETVQSDIFDHIFAVVHEFNLAIYQQL